MAENIFGIDDRQLYKELAKKIIIPYYFTDRVLQVGFIIFSDSHHINKNDSVLTIIRNFLEFGTELRYINKILKAMSVS